MISKSAVPRVVAVLALILALAGAMDLLGRDGAGPGQLQDDHPAGRRQPVRPPLKDRASAEVGRDEAAPAGHRHRHGEGRPALVNATVIDILMKADPAQLKETPVEPATMVWMAFRRGGGKADIVRNVKWGGKKPFPGFTFIIDDLNQTYTFIMPKACANLALVSSEPSREKARLDAEKAAADKAEADRPPPRRPPPSAPASKPSAASASALEAERLAREKAAAEKAAAERAAADKAAADKAAAEEAARRRRRSTTCSSRGSSARSAGRAKSTSPPGDHGKVNESLCAPLFGLKAGAEIKMARGSRSCRPSGSPSTSRRAATAHLRRSRVQLLLRRQKNYFGASVGIWDLFHGEYVTPSIGVQFGSQMWENAKMDKLYFVAEGRIFTRMFGEGVDNNYMFWGGIRYVIR